MQPPWHPCLRSGALDRAALQGVLQRRTEVKRKVCSGYAGLGVQLRCRGRKIRQLLFSPSGDRIAIVSDQTLSLFSSATASLIFHADLEMILANCQWTGTGFWHFGQGALRCCIHGHTGTDRCLHIFSLQPQAGMVNDLTMKMRTYSFLQMEGAHVLWLQQNMIESCPVFSYSGKLLAVPVTVAGVYARLQIIDADTLQVLYDIECDPNCKPHKQAVWSAQDALLTELGKIVHLQSGCSVALPEEMVHSAASRQTSQFSIDRTGAVLATNCTQHYQGSAACFVDTKTGQQLFRVRKTKFVAFLTAAPRALVTAPPLYQVWDLVQRVKLFSLPLLADNPVPMWDDMLFLGKQPHLGRLCYWSGQDAAKLWQFPGHWVVQWCVSPDEASMLVVADGKEVDPPQEIQVTLHRW